MHNNLFKNEKNVYIVYESLRLIQVWLVCLWYRNKLILFLITDKNVLQLVKIADEYQTTSIVEKCKKVMKDLLQSNLKSNLLFEPGSVNLDRLRRARTCLKILTTAKSVEYEAIITEACQTIGRFGHAIFTGTVPEHDVYQEV